jgi:PAS domain-containing protein
VNRRTGELFGYEPDELIDREVELLVPTHFRAGHLAHRAGYVADPRTREMGAGLELYGVVDSSRMAQRSIADRFLQS